MKQTAMVLGDKTLTQEDRYFFNVVASPTSVGGQGKFCASPIHTIKFYDQKQFKAMDMSEISEAFPVFISF